MTFACKWKSMSPSFTRLFLWRGRSRWKLRGGSGQCKVFRQVSIFASFLAVYLVSSGVLGVTGNHGDFSGSSAVVSQDLPKFDVNDLANLIEMFPEFRNYVSQMLSGNLQKNLKDSKVTYESETRSGLSSPSKANQPEQNWQLSPFSSMIANSNSINRNALPITSSANPLEGWNSRKDSYLPINPPASPKHGYQSHYDHGYGYDYPKKPTSHYLHHHNHHNGWGWTADEYKDPKFHYEVGYELGKDLSCLFGLLGFKSIKDISVFSVFSLLKKIKYAFLIIFAFKLGVILSPIALPLLFPLIILAIIAKILPLLLIIVLLFKLLKTQIKLGGREEGTSSILQGTQISRLWESIEDATGSVAKSEGCVEKIICTIKTSTNVDGKGRGFLSGMFSNVVNFMPSVLSWVYPFIRWRTEELQPNRAEDERLLECQKVLCAADPTQIDEVDITTIVSNIDR